MKKARAVHEALAESATASRAEQRAARKRQGRFYTPAWLVGEMLEGCLQASGTPPRPRLLDPACGDGAFVLAAYDRLAGGSASTWQDRLGLIAECLHGVDIDANAIETLRTALLERVDAPAGAIESATRVIAANIRCGDALTGTDFTEPRSTQGAAPGTLDAGEYVAVEPAAAANDETAADSLQHPGCSKPHPGCANIDWSRDFPHVATHGGFDLVLGNPPYLRELRAREIFDRVAAMPLGRKWRQARMDFWHYFVHRGLDLLRPGGRLAFVVNGYWTASTGASKLVRRMEAETTLEALRLFDDAPVFDDVAGRHLTFRLRKESSDEVCCVEDAGGTFHLEPRALYQHGRLSVSRPAQDEITGRPLRERFLVRQGIAENPPQVTARHASDFPERWRVGEGVFVLTPPEVDALDLSPAEHSLLRPYYRASDIKRFAMRAEPPASLLYLTRHTAPDLAPFPSIARHLERFRPLLERRREVGRGLIAWWHLHWPREERLFAEPKILAIQMGEAPRFAVARDPAFVGFAVNVVRPMATFPDDAAAWPLEAVCGLLNSAAAARWFQRHAKHRGVNLDISGAVLSAFPLPVASPERAAMLADLVVARTKAEQMTQARDIASLEAAINECVDACYRAS